MANTFSFSMNKDFLQSALVAIAMAEEREPGKDHAISMSIDLFPDGIGYECSGVNISIVSRGEELLQAAEEE